MRRSLLERLGLLRTTAGAWQEATEAVPVDDLVAASALAREAATPFGYKRPARELLEQFGGDTPDGRRRAAAALTFVGIAAEPPLGAVQPFQWVQLRRAAAAPAGSVVTPQQALVPPPAPATPGPQAAAVEPPADTASPAFEPPAAPEPAPPAPRGRRSLRPADVAARHAPTGPVTRERRFAAGALGLVALVVVMVAAVLLRSLAGDSGGTADALPTGTTPPATVASASTTAKPAAAAKPVRRAPLPGTRPAGHAARRSTTAAAPATVRLQIAPTESSYICIADAGSGRTLFEGMLSQPYEVSGAKLILRVGVATARITANGRPLTINSAPSAYELSPAGVRGLPGDRPVCGG